MDEAGVDFTSVEYDGVWIKNPSVIKFGNSTSFEFHEKGVYFWDKRHTAWHASLSIEFPRGSLNGSLKGVSMSVERFRSQGTYFFCEMVPALCVEIKNSDIVLLITTFRDFSNSAYSEIIGKKDKFKIQNLIDSFPSLTADWMRCTLISKEDFCKLENFSSKAYLSRFVGSDYYVEWDKCKYFNYHELTSFRWFVKELQASFN